MLEIIFFGLMQGLLEWLPISSQGNLALIMAVFFILSPLQKSNLIYEYFYLTNYLHMQLSNVVMFWGWSLCVEEHFYLLVPFLISFLFILKNHRTRIMVLVFLCALALCIRIIIYYNISHSYFQNIFIKTHTRFDTFIAGIILAYVHHYFKDKIILLLRDLKWRVISWLIVIICFLSLFIPRLSGMSSLFQMFAWGTITSIMYIPLIFMLINCRTILGRLLSLNFFRYLASISYGVYLVHWIIIDYLLSHGRNFLANFKFATCFEWIIIYFLAILLSFTISYILHIIIEKPSLYFRKKIIP